MKKRSLLIILLLSFGLLLSACGISGTTTTATGSTTDTTPGEAVTTDTAASDTGTADTHAFITSFIAVGDAGTIIYSDDGGGTWIPAASGTDNNLISIGYGDGRTVAVGEDGVIVYSDNGSEWSGAGTVPEIPGNLNGVAYGDGTWIAVGDRGVTSGTIVKSADGDTWVSVPSVIKQNLNSVAYANGLWVAVGNNGTVIHSTDGETWTPAASVTENHLNAVAYGGEIWVAVGNGVIIVSPDGYNWYVPDDIGDLLHTGDLYTAVAYGSGNGLWVGVGYNFILNIGITLNDYVNDYVYAMPGTAFAGVAYGSGPWVAVGTSGTILRSDDGTAWAPVTSGTNANLAAVAKVERKYEYAVDFSAASTTADPSVCESITGVPWPFSGECDNVGAVWVLESLANKALPSLADTEFTIEAMI
ncbi:MAG: hypothetical protein GXP46_06710, partial [Deferribacteres bacterium]|nr:hypothetical protein [Deferribacteres bacterium]